MGFCVVMLWVSFGAFRSGVCFGVWDLMGSKGGPSGPSGDLQYYLPGDKYPHGICQNREEVGYACLLLLVRGNHVLAWIWRSVATMFLI